MKRALNYWQEGDKFLHEQVRTATIELLHRCIGCRLPVSPGQTYHSYALLKNGEFRYQVMHGASGCEEAYYDVNTR